MAIDSSPTVRDLTNELVSIMETADELRQSDGSASYEVIQQTLSQKLSLHLLSYIRFLEEQGLVRYDRISDEIEVEPRGREVMGDASQIEDAVGVAFADEVGEPVGGEGVSAGYGDVFGDVADDMDEAWSSMDEGGELGEESDEPDEFGDVENTVVVGMGGDEPSTNEFRISKDMGKEADDEVEIAPQRYEEDRDPPVEISETEAQGPSLMNQERYERIEEIGSGGIGTVYRGRQTRLKRDVAIKEIREIFNVFAGVQRDDIIARFESIIQTQAGLNHPNIIQVIDAESSGEYPYSVMELAPNGNLRRLIDHGDRPLLKVSLKYFLQMLHALNTAHDAGVIHGSLKPENVVLDQAGNAKLSDFGITKIVEREGGGNSQVYVGVGSVAYMSPEQFQNPNLATVQSDIYSLGIMFYEMLTGKVPGRRSPMPSSFYPDIPRELDDIFDRMSMDREEDRYDSVEEVIADFYQAKEVTKLLDGRSGVLFLRDPMTHGELGVSEALAEELEGTEVPMVAGAPAGSGSAPEARQEVAASAEEAEADKEEAVDASSAPQDSSETAEAVAEDAAGEAEGEVLDKLDKYGELFDG